MYQCDIQTNTLTFGFLGQPKILKDNRLPSSPFDMDDDFIEDYNPDTYIVASSWMFVNLLINEIVLN